MGIEFPPSVQHMKLNMRDDKEEEVRHYFFPALRFIEQQRRKGNVLVHCGAGISRSVTLVIAYMVKTYEASF